MSALVEAARGVLDRALALHDRPGPARGVLVEARGRLDEPVRVALAGTLKTGKSTLLNALIGERVAPTDAGECTRIVTWYRHAPRPAVLAEDRAGRRRELPVVRGAAGLETDPGPAGATGRLLVDWPSAGLAEATLIDTPGLDSLRDEHSGATRHFVTPDDRPSGADVVLYLMRHAHRSDVAFLEAFADLARGGAGGLGAVGAAGTVVVLARADEIGGGRIDALTTAGQVARSYREDPILRPLCQTVVPVDGLLAETARTLRRDEFTALRALARAPRREIDAMLLSVDRFAALDPPAPAVAALEGDPDGVRLDAATRRALLGRFGLYGVRVATTALRRGLSEAKKGGAVDSPSLAAELESRSGLAELRETLRTRVTGRRDLYKARSALLAVEMVLARWPHPGGDPVAAELERVLTGAHAFVEQRLLVALRTGAVVLPEDVCAEAERLLGGEGPRARDRLGVGDDAEPGAARAAALTALDRWRVRAESPLTARAGAEVARGVVRSLEGVLAAAGAR